MLRGCYIGAVRMGLAALLVCTLALPAAARRGKRPADLAEIFTNMNSAAKRLKTVSADLTYTTVTVLVDDKSTESGQIFFRKGKTTDIRIVFEKPERKILLFRRNKGEIYLPKINQVQEYDLGQKSDLVQQFLLLGFGTDPGEIRKSYDVKYLQEEQINGEYTVLLEITPRTPSVAAQISKIQMWVSEESWLPVRQKFFESGGDYLVATYSAVKVNFVLPGSDFELNAPSDAKYVKMN